MLIEVYGTENEMQTCANVLQKPIEYCEDDKRGRCYVKIEAHNEWSVIMARICDLSCYFRVIVEDSFSHQLVSELYGNYRAEFENGDYRLLDEYEGFDCHEDLTPVLMFQHLKDGVECDPPLVEERTDADDHDSMMVYQCGDNLSATLDSHNIPGTSTPPAPQVRLILPEPTDPSVD